jgi:hypothetical protein
MATSGVLWVVFGGVIALAMGGCAPIARQYTLRVDLSDQSNTQLCHRDAGQNAKKIPGSREQRLADEECEVFAAQSLSTPGTLTVQLQHPSPQAKYDLRVSQFTREANPSDAQKILATVIERAAEIGKLISKDHGGEVVANAATSVQGKAPEIAAAVVSNLSDGGGDAPKPKRAEPSVIFAPPYVDAKKRLLPAKDSRGSVLSSLNAPAAPLPPPRAYKLNDADLEFLSASGVTADQLADFAIDWCSAESFQAEADAKLYAMLDTQPQVDELKQVLQIDGKDVAAMLLARSSLEPLQTRINNLLVEGRNWDKASPAARTFAALRVATSLISSLRHCQENIAFLQTKVSVNERAKLEALAGAGSFTKLAKNALKYAEAFEAMFGALLQKAFVETEKVVQLASADSSTTITLEPGRIELGVGQTDAAGKRTEAASYKVQARGVERLAILLGPAFTYCNWGCFDRVDQVVVQADPMNASSVVHTEIRKLYHTHDFALATALHVTFYRFSDFGLGGVLGYPIGAARGTSSNILVGVGLRHSSGLELSLGLHAFSSRVLKSAYEGQALDLTKDGNQGLTIDSVTEDAPQWAGFLMIGFAPDVFSTLKE